MIISDFKSIYQTVGRLQLLAPDNYNAVPLLSDWEAGGMELGDVSQGNTARTWGAIYENGGVYIFPEDTPAEKTLALSVAGVTEISFTFDQLMRISVAYVVAGVAYLYWYDTAVAGFVTTTITGAISPKLTLDDKSKIAHLLAESTVILFYIKDNEVCYRLQNDRFGIEYKFTTGLVGVAQRINKVGLDKANRMHIEVQLRADS